jgi:ABC-type multidrug transport system fused ATPase/permease subunit
LLAVLVLGTTALQLVGPQILRRFIDAAQTGRALQTLLGIAGMFIGVALIGQAVAVAATYTSERVGWRATNTLRADLALHCLQLDMPFHTTHTPGEMIERIDGDVTALANFFGQFVIQIVGNLLLLVGVLGVLFWEDWRVGAALAVFALITLLVLVRSRDLAVPAFQASRQADAELYGFLEERIAGSDDVRANGAGTYMLRRFHEQARARFFTARKAELLGAGMFGVTTSLFAFGYVVALALGILLYERGAVTVGTVFLIFQYTALLQRPITILTRQLEDLQRAGAGIVRIQELFSLQPQIVDGTRAVPPGACALEFREVTFGYSNGPPDDRRRTTDGDQLHVDHHAARISHPSSHVVHDISFELEPGTVLGLLGRTGSGKTTLTRLLLRLYEPSEGLITLGGVDVRQIQLDVLRQRIGVVTQEVQLLAGTLRDNLALFDPAIDDARMLAAIEALGLRPWFGILPDGLDTELRSGGTGLSAGEAQLLALTRVFLRDPGVIILDEASSRLDPATERLLQQAIERLLQGRTAIIIAHRLQTVERADTIMILEQGRIVEYGLRTQLANAPDSRFSNLLRTGLKEVLA